MSRKRVGSTRTWLGALVAAGLLANAPAVGQSPADSPLLAAIKYESFEMPPKGKLPQAQIDRIMNLVLDVENLPDISVLIKALART